jgi:dolichol-phosphate mannosyltransferase
MSSLVSIVLPTYDEAGNIVDLIRAIDHAVTRPKEIIVVDDNSPDGTSQLVAGLIQEGSVPGLRLETRMTDRGLTKSLRRGIELSKGDVVLWMDCDFSMPPEILPKLLTEIDEGYDIAVGSRFVRGGSAKQGEGEESKTVIALSKILNWLTRMLLSPSFHDYTSGFIAVRKRVLVAIPLRGDYGEYFMDFIYRAILRGEKIIEIPYVCVPRRAGVSKTAAQVVRFGKKYLATLVRLWGLRMKKAFSGAMNTEK